MATYKQDTVETAVVLMRELLAHPVVNQENNSGLIMRIQRDSDVLNLWQEVFEPVLEVKLLKAGDEFYLSTGIERGIFSASNEDLRGELGIATNTELFTCSFIVLTLIAALFNSDDTTGPSQDYINLTELEELVTSNFEALLGRDDIEVLENEARVNLVKPGQFWLDLPTMMQDAVRPRMTNTRWGFLLKTLSFLAKNQLVRLIDDRLVFPEPRLNILVANYYNRRDHKNLILEMIRTGGDENGTDQSGAPA
jgi:hypothetical protein